jgi:hypothetical protein
MTSDKPKLVVSSWKRIDRGALLGSFSVTLSSGLQIHKVRLFDQGGAQWIGMPCEKYRADNGSPVYTPLIDFISAAVQKRFREQVSEAIKAAGWLTAKPPVIEDSDIPF